MITDDLITAAVADLVANKLTAAAVSQLLTYIRNLDRYKNTPGLFPGLADKLAGAEGFAAQYLQAALNGAKALGSGDVSLSGGTAAVTFSLVDNRNEFFNDALNFLYDIPAQRPTSAVVQMDRSTVADSGCGCDFGNRARLVF